MANIRSGSGKILPAIQSSYANEFADPRGRDMYSTQAWNTPRGAENRAVSRIQDFEGRLHAQERTTHNLIDRAYKIKEDIIDNLNITHHTWQEEKRNRELLQEHIRTITDVVRKLNRDITLIETEIKQKENAIGGTQDNVKTLEMHHVAGLTDVRGRVARCDAAISRLSADMKGCSDSIGSVNHNQTEKHTQLLERLGHIDTRISELFNRIEKNQSENEINIRHVEADTGNQVSGLDSRTRQILEESRNMLHTYKALETAEREKLETRLVAHVDQQNILRDQRVERFERATEDHMAELTRRLTQLEEHFHSDRDKSVIHLQTLESRFLHLLDAHKNKHTDDLANTKRETRDGFSSVHESITNMKQVMDGKRKLLEEQIRKEIAQIRKMVVLI